METSFTNFKNCRAASKAGPLPQGLGAHRGIDGLAALYGDGAGGKARFGGVLQVRALEVGPGDGSHESVAAAGGVDHVGRQHRQAEPSSGAVGG